MTHHRDTIDLRELFQILKQKKRLIVLVTLMFVILASAYVFISKPVYQVSAMIELGKLAAGTKDEKSLDDIKDLKQKLEYIYGVSSKKKRPYPRVKAISIKKQAKGIFLIVVEGHSNENATLYIEEMVKKIEKNYIEQVNTFIDTQKELITLTHNDIKTAQQNLTSIQNTLKNYNQKIMSLSEKDAALAGIYTIQLSQNQTQVQELQSHISELKTKLYNLKLAITPLRIKNTKIIGEIEILDKPIKPKKALTLIVSFITGLMFSIFLVFFLAFMQGFKEEE